MPAFPLEWTVDTFRLAFVVGVAVSVLLRERWNLTTGSVVVPGYIAASLASPWWMLTTAMATVVCHVVVDRLLSARLIVPNHTRFVLLAVTSIASTGLARYAGLWQGGGGMWDSLAHTAGFLAPALIAHDVGRHGAKRTLRGVLLATGAVLGVVGAASLVISSTSPVPADLGPASGFGTALPLVLLVSSALAGLVQRHLGLRAGGFVGGAYVALLAADLRSLLAIVGLAALTHLVVTGFVARHTILFGRRKFSAMVFVGSLLGWAATSALGGLGGIGLLGNLAIVPLLLPGLIANDVERVGTQRTVTGLSVCAAGVLALILGTGALASTDPSPTLTGVALAGGAGLVWAIADRRRRGVALGAVPG